MDKILQTIVDAFGTCEVYDKGTWMPLNTDYINNKWDVQCSNTKFNTDLDYGKIGEEWCDKIIADKKTVEIKTERYKKNGKTPFKQWYETKNVVIETRGRHKVKSGILITKADCWMQVLAHDNIPHCAITFKRHDLLALCIQLYESKKAREVSMGDDLATTGLLISIEDLLYTKLEDKYRNKILVAKD